MPKKHSQDVLEQMESSTLGYYQANAESFWQGTRDHDVSQNIQALLSALPVDKPLDILDFGCGPGRDLLTFKKMGHRPVGLDGSKAFCDMAHAYSQCPVLHQSFLNLDLGIACFDGIFANASLFHVPKQELPKVLKACYQALRPKGILFTSNPRGCGESWQGERYGHFMEFESSKAFLEKVGFMVLDHYYRPDGLPRDQQPWLAIISRR